MQNWVQQLKWAIILILTQVLILNNIHWSYFTAPLLYVYLITKLSSEVRQTSVLLWAFITGLVIDIFSNTPGMNAATLVWTAFLRKPFLKMNQKVDANESFIPSIRSMGTNAYLGYTTILVFIHATVFNLIDDFSFFRPLLILQKSIICTLTTVTLILCMDAMRRKKT